jgi:hypothetical protein
MSKQQIIISVVVAIVFAGVGFFGGMKYASTSTALAKSLQGMSAQQRQALLAQMRPGGANGGAGAGGGFGGRGGGAGRGGAGGGFVGGQILSKDDKSITISLPGGGSRIIFYSSSTQVNKPTTVDASELTTGQQVVVSGSTNSDGSVTATNIQIRTASQTPPAQQ